MITDTDPCPSIATNDQPFRFKMFRKSHDHFFFDIVKLVSNVVNIYMFGAIFLVILFVHQHLFFFCIVAAVYITCICNSPFERVTPTIIAAIVHLVCEILTNFFRLWLIVGHWYFWKFPQISKRQFIKVWSVNNVYVTVYITHYSKS